MAPGKAGPEPNSDPQQRIRQFSKTKLCKFELLGMCTKGPLCPFAHGQAEMRALPDLRRTKLCATVVQTGHCDKENCAFAHTKEELRSTGAFHKTKLCRFMQSGHCSLGTRCNFAHTADEVRPAEAPNEDAPAVARTVATPAMRRVQFKVPVANLLVVPPGLEDWAGAAQEGGDAAAGPTARLAKAEHWKVPLGNPAYVPLPGGLIIDQSENIWKVTPQPPGAAYRLGPMRTVRTSESTLCTLGDLFEALEPLAGAPVPAPAMTALHAGLLRC